MQPEVSLVAPVVGNRYYKMLYTVRSISLASTDNIWVRWVFASKYERNQAMQYLHNEFAHRTALELRKDKDELAILMRYKVTPFIAAESRG